MVDDAERQDEEWSGNLELANQEEERLIDVLAGVKIFEYLSIDELRQVERIVHRRTYLPQETVVQQGNPGVGMYIIQSGSVNVVLETHEGGEIQLATLGAGQFFGEMSLLDGAPRAASVVAIERASVIGFFHADLMDLIARDPRLGHKIVHQISILMAGRLQSTLADFRSVQRQLRALDRGAQKAAE